MLNKLTSKITRYGVSDTFHSLIDGIRETTGVHGVKYRKEDVDKVAQYLICRNYGKLCLELSYLCWAVIHARKTPLNQGENDGVLAFFWLEENTTPSKFRAAFTKSLALHVNNPNIRLNDHGLCLSFNGSADENFVISPSRIGVLAVMLEFIVSIAPEQLKEIDKLAAIESTKKIKDLSSHLQKLLYQFLAQHIQQAQQQRRFRYITQWLTTTNNQNLTDQLVLSFWQAASIDNQSPGYKLYTTALTDLIDTFTAIEDVSRELAVGHAKSIGSNLENDEYSPDLLVERLSDYIVEQPDLSWLCDSPKFLTKAQWQTIQPLVTNKNIAHRLTLSFARRHVFGRWQANIVQAKRKSVEAMYEKLAEAELENYQDYIKTLLSLSNSITKVNLAIVYMFYQLGDSRYLGLALETMNKDKQQEVKKLLADLFAVPSDTSQHADGQQTLNQALFIASKKVLLQSPTLQKVLTVAKQAYSGNNKDGFQKLPDDSAVDRFQEGNHSLVQCKEVIDRYVQTFNLEEAEHKDQSVNYRSDVSIFTSMFRILYEESNG